MRGMRQDLPQDETLQRGRKNALKDARRLATSVLDSRVRRSGFRLRRWLIVILLLFFTSIVVINSYNGGRFPVVRLRIEKNSVEEDEPLPSPFTSIVNSDYLVSNKGCQIPAMEPFDVAISRFVHREKAIVCEAGTTPPLVESNNVAIFLNPATRNLYYNVTTDIVNCCWTSFVRDKDKDNSNTYNKECYFFNDSDRVYTAEFVKVECWRGKENIYKDYHAFTPRKEDVEERCRKIERSGQKLVEDRLSVLVIGIDSVSRLNFRRSMPKTVNTLKSLNAAEMLGYTKVADNTYPNLVAVLAGLHQEELHQVCWQNKRKTFDECPFIWQNFSAAGYRTVFAEDACHMSIFNYLKPGFRRQPTDYYLRPYCIEVENDIGNTKRLNANLCVGTRLTFANLLHYCEKVASTFANDRYFAFTWMASLTHDYLNFAQLGDEAYYRFVRYLVDNGLLNNTAVVVMSDHGMRFGDFRQTYQGKMEDSLPFVFFLLPPWWRSKYSVAWANMRRNSRSLTTGFDLHETLMDLLNPRGLDEQSLMRRRKSLSNGKVPRGISWFLPIPDHRTCSMAAIPGNLCVCHGSRDVALNDTAVRNGANFLMFTLNGMLKQYPQCASLTLATLKQAKILDNANGNSSWNDYSIQFQTLPGEAIFEATVRYRHHNRTSYELIGTIGRLNAYGKQSACMTEFNMRLYCYCL